MRILFFTDTHIRGTTPKNRKDNLIETLEKKFEEVLQLAKKYNVDYILHGGDLFDRPDISMSIVRRFALVMSKSNIPIYCIAGNHDVYGHNPDTLHRTLLGLFDAIGLINLINEGDVVTLEKDNVRVQLTGQPYKYDIDNDNNRHYYMIKEKPIDVDYAIHMVHGMLLDKPFIKGIQYTLIDDIVDTRADITLAGHYHSGFGVKKIDNKYFINPGSLIRITNSLREIERYPQVVIISLEKDINVELIQLETAKPGNEILDRQQIEISMYRNERIIQFKQSIESTSDFDKLDINYIINTLSSIEGATKEIKDEAVKRISQAQMLLKGDEILE